MANPPASASTLTAALRSPDAYKPPPRSVDFVETHISWIFLADRRVYKVKKPVDLGFLDFTTLERRKFFCEEEVRLNRRLAPWVYRGVVPITRSAGGWIEVGGGRGEVIEWAVEMERLPADRMLARMLDRGEIDNGHVRELAGLLAGFHAAAATGAGVDEHGSAPAIANNVRENFDQLRPFLGDFLPADLVGYLERRAETSLAGHAELFRRRVRNGRIREGHGDLHAGNICFAPAGLAIYDCIEFNRRFRCGDVASDLAFLAMDLDLRGFPAFASYLVREYARKSGDPQVERLISFYKAYRAVVRAKVATFTAKDITNSRREGLRVEALRYLQLAASYDLPPAMILTCGLPGSGKSYLARQIAAPLRASILHSDVQRKTQAGITPKRHAPAGYEQGLYTPEAKRSTYRALLGRAVEQLEAGHSVIVDASFARREYRRPFLDAATRLGRPCVVLHVRASEEEIRRRMELRSRDKRAVSDADFEIYRREKEAFEPPVETPGKCIVEVDSPSEPPEDPGVRIVETLIRALSAEKVAL